MRVPLPNVLVLFGWVAMALARPASAARIDLPTLGGSCSEATDINAAGQVVGWSALPGDDFVRRASLYDNGVIVDLGTLGGDYSLAYAINDVGQVVGGSETAAGEYHAFLYSGGVMTDLGTLGGTVSEATGINNSGQIIGVARTSENRPHAFLYDSGIMTDLGTLGGYESYPIDINDSGHVVGRSEIAGSPGVYHSFLYSGGVMTDLDTLVGYSTRVSDINNAGQVVGSSFTAADGSGAHAFLYSGGVMTDLGTLHGGASSATAINDYGEVVGRSDGRAFVYRGGVMTDLGTLGGKAIEATGINNAGEIVGSYIKGGRRAFFHADGASVDLGVGYSKWINDAGQIIGGTSGIGSSCGDFLSFRNTLACGSAPLPTCLPGAKSSFQLRDDVDGTKDQIKWRWGGGGAVAQADLGTPDSTTAYTLCIYDSTGDADMLVGSLNTGFLHTAWRSKDPNGWNYQNKTGFEDGVAKIQLKTGIAGKSRVKVQARGVNIPMPTPFSGTQFFGQDARVTVQLINDSTNACWSSEFATSTKNSSSLFSAKTR